MNHCLHNKQIIPVKVVAAAVACFLALFACATMGQGKVDHPNGLVVGTIFAPPFSMKLEDGSWEGMSIDIWESIAKTLDVDYEVREFDNVAQLTKAVQLQDVDVVLVLPALEKHETNLDLSQAYFRSGLAIAVPADGSGHGLLGYLTRLDALKILAVVALLLLLWLIAGACLWLVEHRRNHDMFGGTPAQGLGHAVWWAAVTMTTVGYGDKAPRTAGGRIIAIIWMFTSIILISGFTAAISASLTAERLSGKVRGLQDLPHVRVGAVALTESVPWLRQRGISAVAFPEVKDALQAIVDHEIDAFVFDEAVLKSISSVEFPGRIFVLPKTFEHYYLSMAVNNGSALREPINRALLQFMATDEWNSLLARHSVSTN